MRRWCIGPILVASLGGCGSSSHSGPPAEQPSTVEVERSRREDAELEIRRPHRMIQRRHGPLKTLSCHETTRGVWLCTLTFRDGLLAVERVAWYQNADTEGISVVSERRAGTSKTR
jgi:hypothetical protein